MAAKPKIAETAHRKITKFRAWVAVEIGIPTPVTAAR
jgi:hypothetical protein